MRFKLFYEENRIKINVLTDNSSDTILPENLDQHVYYPIPNEFIKQVQTSIQDILSVEDSTTTIQEIDCQMAKLIQKRKDALVNMKKKYNPKIMEFCEEYKINNPEWFI